MEELRGFFFSNNFAISRRDTSFLSDHKLLPIISGKKKFPFGNIIQKLFTLVTLVGSQRAEIDETYQQVYQFEINVI